MKLSGFLKGVEIKEYFPEESNCNYFELVVLCNYSCLNTVFILYSYFHRGCQNLLHEYVRKSVSKELWQIRQQVYSAEAQKPGHSGKGDYNGVVEST